MLPPLPQRRLPQPSKSWHTTKTRMALGPDPCLPVLTSETFAAKAVVAEHAACVDIAVCGAIDEDAFRVKLVLPADTTIEKGLIVETPHVSAAARIYVPDFARLDEVSPAPKSVRASAANSARAPRTFGAARTASAQRIRVIDSFSGAFLGATAAPERQKCRDFCYKKCKSHNANLTGVRFCRESQRPP